jgi:uncharacterized protein (DUF1330 family)
MAKGYWIVRVDVKNEEVVKRYAAGNHPIFKKFGGRYVVRASALACYHSPQYQTNKKIRDGHLTADFVIVEGYDGPQP